jgi:hypothetical protein
VRNKKYPVDGPTGAGAGHALGVRCAWLFVAIFGAACGASSECALNGEPWAISQVADRIDGKATAEIQTEQRHRYVIEAPAELTREQWIAKHSPTPEVTPASPPTITQ